MSEESIEPEHVNASVKSLRERFEQQLSGVIHHSNKPSITTTISTKTSSSIVNSRQNNGIELNRTKSEGGNAITANDLVKGRGADLNGFSTSASEAESERSEAKGNNLIPGGLVRPTGLRRRSSSLEQAAVRSEVNSTMPASASALPPTIPLFSTNSTPPNPSLLPLKFKPPPPIPPFHSRPSTSSSLLTSIPSSPSSIVPTSLRKPPPPPPSRSSTSSSFPIPSIPTSNLHRASTFSSHSTTIRSIPPPIPPPSVNTSKLSSQSALVSPSVELEENSSPQISPVQSNEDLTQSELVTDSIPSVSARPIIPPRPIMLTSSPSILESRAPPPPIPTRLTSTSSPIPTIVSLPTSNEVSVSALTIPTTSALAPSPFLIPPPPPPRRSISPSPVISLTRSRSSSIVAGISPTSTPPKVRLPLPSTISSSPPQSASSSSPYLPPPPPSRIIAAHERLAPQRPAIEKSSNGNGSGDDSDASDTTESEELFLRSQEFPDSTFANRRPPILRNRKPIQANGQIFSFAIRGTRAVTGQHHVYVWNPSHVSGLSESAVALPGGEHKVHAIEFRPSDADVPAHDSRYVWGGTKDGHVFEIDIEDHKVSNVRLMAHSHSVIAIYRLGRSMLTLDDSGKLLVWGTFDSSLAPDLNITPKAQRIADKQNFVGMVGEELWTASGPLPRSGPPTSLSRGPQIRVYDPTGRGPFTVTPRPITTPESAGQIGAVTASAIVPSQNHLVYLGHDNGYVSVWSRSTYLCLLVQRVSPFGITSLVGVNNYLWAGFRTGSINIYDVEVEPWVVRKSFKAHKDAVVKMVVDSASLWTDDTLQVASCGTDLVIQFWDGLLRTDWLDSEMQIRQSEYCDFRTIRSLSISWNIDASKPTDLIGTSQNIDFLHQCLTSVDSPDIISFGFQEVIDLESKSLTAKTMLLGKKKNDKLSDGVSSSYRLWHDKLVQAVRLAMPAECPYTVIHVGDLVGLFSCIFVKQSEAVNLRDVALVNVKTGMKGRYGNKGALLARFVIDDTSICFINVHLAAGQSHRRQRDSDLVEILSDKTAFSLLSTSSPGAYAAGGEGGNVFDHELCILAGDLNYRIDGRRDWVLGEVEKENWTSLLNLDQLKIGLEGNLSFRLRSFKEMEINFAPTYKYDPGTDNYDSSAKKRIPAWCDRILYRADKAEKVTPLHYQRYECNISDHKPISAAFDLEVKSILPDKRALIWKEVEKGWTEREVELLKEARIYYKAT